MELIPARCPHYSYKTKDFDIVNSICSSELENFPELKRTNPIGPKEAV